MAVTVRDVGVWVCPYDGVLKIRQLMSAVLLEPTCLLLRKGEFEDIDRARRIFARARNSASGPALLQSCRNDLIST